jgi:TonB family protein
MQGDLPVRGRARGEVSIGPPRTTTVAMLAANGITAPDGSAPELPPRPEMITDAVWPHAHLLRGESGSASADFTVQPNGKVTEVKVREATAPEFGQALVAALGGWQFEAALAGSTAGPVVLRQRVEFKAPPVDATQAPPDDPLARLVILARKGALRGAGGDLDEKLTPLYRVVPVYPEALASEKPAGQAVIEFVIDRDGRARLPRIVSATREEFGWAAATAVAQWLFRAPTRGGAPTEVMVQIPVQF